MTERDLSIDLGGRVIVETGFLGTAVVDVTKDIHSSKGIDAGIKFGGIAPNAPHWTGEKQVTVAAVGGVRYQSDKVIDQYFGVKNTEVTADRSAYKGKSATTPFIGFEAQANLTPHITIDGGLGVSKTATSIRNSALTDDKKYALAADIGFTYWF
jgi:outer membrane scaffolding protein for murein synthesis (MipA/OmpV family)